MRYLTGMSLAMKKRFNFVQVVGEGRTVVTDIVMGMKYNEQP